MPRGSLVLAIYICSFLLGCGREAESAAPQNNVDGALELSRIPCRYNLRVAVSYQCFVARRRDGIVHDYHLTILSLKESKISSPLAEDNETSGQAKQEAIVAIPGGPGQGGQTKDDWVASWAEFLIENKFTYDLILFDPPGTVGSSAYWQCAEYDQAAMRLAAENIGVSEEAERLSSVLDRCLERYHQKLIHTGFSKKGLQGLATKEYVKRLHLLMNRLHYDQYHLIATSYGTRVAMLLGSDTKVATLTLDSVYPHERGSIKDIPALIAHSERLHAQHFDSLIDSEIGYQKVMNRAMAELEKRPQLWQLDRWDGEGDIAFMLNPSRLNDLAFSTLYDESMLEYFYSGLMNIEERSDELRWTLEDFVTQAFDPGFSTMTFIATECSDNRRISFESFMIEARKYPELEEDWPLIFEQDVCSHILFEGSDKIYAEKYSAKPTIIFSGELDPVTPTFWAEDLSLQLQNARTVLVKGVGHAVLSSTNCDASALAEFWRTRDPNVTINCEGEMAR